jgi:hypothetical protein
MHGEMRNVYKIFVENLKGDADTDESILNSWTRKGLCQEL